MACYFIRWDSATETFNTQRLSRYVIDQSFVFSGKRRWSFLQGRILLAEVMFYLYGIPTLPPIAATPSGRPCFADSHLPNFSLAYAGNTVGVLLSTEGKVGLDIEVMRARGHNQLHQYLSSTESTWISAQYDKLEAETQLWCIRQSVLKLSGLGNRGQGSLQLYPFSGHLCSDITPRVQVMSDAEEYFCWACAHEPNLERLICWQYEEGKGLQQYREISSLNPPPSTHFLKLSNRIAALR